MPKRIIFTEEQKAELVDANKAHKGTDSETRLYALMLYAQGLPVAEICKAAGCSEPSVTLWARTYIKDGLSAITGISTTTIREIRKIESAMDSVNNPDIKKKLYVILLKLKRIPMATIRKETDYNDGAIYSIYGYYRKKGLEDTIKNKGQEVTSYRNRQKVFSVAQISEMGLAYESASNPVFKRRYRLLLLRMQGTSLAEAAKKVSMAQSAATKIWKAYQEEGISAVQSHAAKKIYEPRNHYRFSAAQAEEVQQAFEQARYLKDKARLEILLLSAKGKTVAEIRDATGYSASLIRKDIASYFEHGLPKSPHGGGNLLTFYKIARIFFVLRVLSPAQKMAALLQSRHRLLG